VVNTIASVDTTGSSSVSVLLQDAANPGKFLPATNYLTGFAPVAVAADDLNQDGRIDLVVSNAVGFTILLQSSTAPGQFVAEPSVTVAGGGTAGIAIADVNGDGRNDIIATATDVMVYLQDPVAAGSFLAPMHYMAGAQPYSILTEDLNGDGRPDLAVANLGSADGTVKANMSVLLQNPAGRGTFLPATNYATGVRAWTIAAGDLNGDGKQDLVVGNMGSFDGSSISVFMQNPASPGSFQPAVNYADTSNVGWVAIADMNGDGKPDLLIVDAGVSVRFQDSAHPGTFLAPTVIVSP
jgi:hypothetical protein